MEEGGLVWQSLQWQDGTRYSGLTKNGKMHSHGVLTFPNKDRYEGMFEDGKLHGAGVYVYSTGMIYRGDWQQGVMHGCGTRIWKQPDGSVKAAEGKFFGDEFVGDVMPCSSEDGFDSAVEADMAAFQARSFQWPFQGRSQQSQVRPRVSKQPGQAAQQQRMLQQPPPLPQWGAGQPVGGGGGNAGGGVYDQQQEQKLQGLLQRLVADKMTETKKRPA